VQRERDGKLAPPRPSKVSVSVPPCFHLGGIACYRHSRTQVSSSKHCTIRRMRNASPASIIYTQNRRRAQEPLRVEPRSQTGVRIEQRANHNRRHNAWGNLGPKHSPQVCCDPQTRDLHAMLPGAIRDDIVHPAPDSILSQS